MRAMSGDRGGAAQVEEPTTDAALAAVYARGRERSALERLVERRWSEAVRVARRALGDPAAAEDAAQDAMVRMAAGLGRYDAGRAFDPWFRTVLANAVRDALRALAATRSREPSPAEPESAPPLSPAYWREGFAGYRLRMTSPSIAVFDAAVDPIEPGRTGDRWFHVDETGAIRFSTTGAAGRDSPRLGG